MITSLHLIDFKNFAKATLRMGPFTVVVGANASGKSNLRDAFRILHGIGRGYNLADAVGGKYGAGGQVEWNQVRGAFGEIIRFERPAFGLHVAMRVSAGSTSRPNATRNARYSIQVGGDERKPRTFRTTSEELDLTGWEPIYTSDPPYPDPTTGKVQLAFKESTGRKVSAYVASDGTLRFLAMLAALLGANPARLYFFEEIDNGIHPSRLRLLTDLIERCTATNGVQVVATTHSPDLLSMIGDETFRNTSVVCRRPDTDTAVVQPVASLPNADELRQSQGLGRLHASGWMEDAIFFTEGMENEAPRWT